MNSRKKNAALVLTGRLLFYGHPSNAIRDVFETSGRRFGSARICIQLQARGFRISKKRAIQLMREMDLTCKSEPIPYDSSEHSLPVEKYYNVKII